MLSHIHWVRSNGGPYILAGIQTASHWKGIYGLSANDGQESHDDYLRACAIKGYTGIITGNEGEILVINDLPNDLMSYSNNDSEAVLVKWIGADSDEQILKSLNGVSIINIGFEDQGILLSVIEPDLVIFDAANLLEDVHDNKLILRLTPGSYAVSVANYEPNDKLMLQLYRLSLVQRKDI